LQSEIYLHVLYQNVFEFDSQRSTKQLTAAKTFYDWWADSDYEYSLKVPSSETGKLYSLFGVAKNDEARKELQDETRIEG